MSEGGIAKSTSGNSVLRRVDDAVFAVEQAIVSAFLIAITIFVFLDVLYRRLAAPDSKVGALVARIFGIEDEGTRAFIDGTLAPWVGAVIGFLLLWFAFWSAERHKKAPLLPIRGGAVVLAFGTAMAFTALGGLMLNVASKWVYLALYTIAVLLYVWQSSKRKTPGWQIRVATMLLVVTPIFVYCALFWFPRGYSWSKEISLMLLLWVGFFGASVCAHEGKHLRMEAFEKLFTPKLARIVRIVGFTFTGLFSGFLAYLGYLYIFAPQTGAYYLGGVFEQTQIPDWISTVAVPIGFGIAMLRFFGAAVSAARGGDYGAPPVEESLKEAEKLKAEMEGAPVAEAEEAKS